MASTQTPPGEIAVLPHSEDPLAGFEEKGSSRKGKEKD